MPDTSKSTTTETAPRKGLSVGRRLTLGFAAALAALPVIGGASYLTINSLLESEKMVEHTYVVLGDIQQLRSSLKDAETGQRGYLITGLDAYLEPHAAAVKALPDIAAELRELTSDNPRQQERLDRVDVLIDDKLAELDETIDLRRQAGFEQARAVVLTDKGKTTMDQLRGDLDAMVAEESALLETRSADSAAAAARAKQILLWGVLLAAGAVAFLARQITRSITGKVAQVTEMATRFGSGDLTARAEVSGGDEIAEMAEAINRGVANMRETVQTLSTSAGALSSSAQELTGVATSIAGSAQHTAEQASSMAAGAEQVSRNVQSVATGSEEMGASIHEIARNASEAAGVAAGAVTVASSANATVVKLGDSSREIGAVVKVITSIAEQTNLLALNATIEAARAGEAGKGFAVVANEVKELAQETAKATEDISQRIAAIQGDTSSAVDAIAEISEVIARINGFQTTIAAAVEEQTATTNEMNRSTAEAATGSGDIAANVSSFAQAANDTRQGVARSQEAANELAVMSTQLQSLVGQFTI